MGRSGSDGYQSGAFDRARCRTARVVYLLGDCEEGCHDWILDGCVGYGGVIWRYVCSLTFLGYMLTDAGFMTFCPEWLTGNQNLDASNFMFKWVYLVFFNMLWVFLPLYAMYHAYVDMKNAFMVRNGVVLKSLEAKQRNKSK